MNLSSKERLLRTIEFERTDHVPLCVLLWSSLRSRCSSTEEYVQRQLDLGLDAVVPLPHLAWDHDRRVEVEICKEDREPYALVHKVYRTPGGQLEAIAEQTADWPHGDDIPVFSDFNVPRSEKFLVTAEEDLEPLKYLLADPDPAAIERFRRRARELKAFADERQLAVVTPGVRLADSVFWLCGPTQFATWGLTQPDLLKALFDIIARWQRKRVELYLEERPDIFVRAEWYATPFLSPDLFERFLSPLLQPEIESVHRAGARYCLVATANVMPYLGILKKLNVDVLYGIDPIEGDWDLAGARAACGDGMSLWGGMNGYLQVAHASPAEVEQAVRSAIEVLAPGGGLILCPVDDIGLSGTDQDSDETWNNIWANVLHMAEAWKKHR